MLILRFFIRWYGRLIIYGVGRILAKVTFYDCSEGLKPEKAAIYVANHRSASDGFMMAVLPFDAIQVVNIWPFKIPIIGLCARLAEYLSVRTMSYEDFSASCKKLYDENVSICAFPEGTRSGSTEMGLFHGALFRVAIEHNIPIVPLCIIGNEDKPSKGRLLIKPGKIDIYELPMISAEFFENMSSYKLKNKTKNIMQHFINEREYERRDKKNSGASFTKSS